jgi:non-ribosomal peptide synthetase component F
MGLNRTAKGIVLVPSLLLGGAFLAAGVWGDGPEATNRALALSLGGLLMAAGLLAQLLPEGSSQDDPPP